MVLNNIINFLTLILALLGVIFIHSKVYRTIIIIIGVAIFIINIYITQKAKKKIKDIDYRIKALDYEAQRHRLIEKSIPVRYINGLGKNPLFKQAYQSGQEYKKREIIKMLLKIIKKYLNIL